MLHVLDYKLKTFNNKYNEITKEHVLEKEVIKFQFIGTIKFKRRQGVYS